MFIYQKLWLPFTMQLLVVMRSVNNVVSQSGSNNPNILFIMLDDAGWADFSFNNASLTQTPHMDKLATQEGLVLTNYYVQPQCTPTRAALLTGRYPFRYGLQGDTISPCQPYGLPLSENDNLLTNLFKQYGDYETYLIGKWVRIICLYAGLPCFFFFFRYN